MTQNPYRLDDDDASTPPPQQQQPSQPAQPPPGRPPSSGASGCLIGCGVAALIALIIVVVAGVWIYTQGRAFAADGIKTIMVETIKQSSMPEDQKADLIAQVEQLTEDFKAGDVTLEDLANVMEELENSPLLALAGVWIVHEQYIKNSALTDEEKADAKRQIERFARGVFEEKIPQSAVEQVVDSISFTDADGNQQVKQTLSTEELKALVADVKKRADDAEIPDEPFEVNIAEEFRNVIERGLNRSPAPAAP